MSDLAEPEQKIHDAYIKRRDLLRVLDGKLYDELLMLVEDKKLDADQLISAKKAISTELNRLETGLQEIGKKMVKAETHNHLTLVFNKTQEEIEAMSPAARELYEGMRISAAKVLGATSG